MTGLGPLLVTRPRLALDVLAYVTAAGGSRRRALRAWATECLPLWAYRALRVAWVRARQPDIGWLDAELRWRMSPPVESSDRWRAAQLEAVGPRLGAGITMMDRIAARSGVDLRHPFADQGLLEFLLSLPPEAKHAGGRWKALVRDGFPELPGSVRHRPGATRSISSACSASTACSGHAPPPIANDCARGRPISAPRQSLSTPR